MEKSIFDSASLGNLNLKNRLIRSGTSQAMSPDLSYAPSILLHVYEELAKGGVGAIITSFPLVNQAYYRDAGTIENREKIYEKLTENCHAENCPVIAQLVLTEYKPVIRMTAEDMKAVVDMFVTAAEKADAVGYDGVQIHVAHGLYLSQLISPAYNRRSDDYGGNQQNRCKIVLEILRRIKAEYPSLHLSMKINHSDGIPGGLSEEQSLESCRLCEEAGLESVEVSGNGASASGIRAGVNEGYFKHFALQLADVVSIPVILVGGNRNIESMNDVLNQGKVEFMAMSRPLICEPGLPNRWMNGDTKPSKCISCNMCYHTPWQQCIKKGIREA